MKQPYTVDELKKDIAEGREVFPLQTINSLIKRWGLNHGAIYNRTTRDKEFPGSVQGFIEGMSHNNRLYPMYKIREYEEKRVKK